MRANHSPLQFAGLIATAGVLACGVCANAALARTMPSTTASNGASASAVLVGSSSAPETRTRTAVDSNRTSRALLSSPSAAPAGSATGGQHLVPVTSPAAPATPASPPPAGSSSRVDIAGTPLVGAGRPARAPTGANVPSATITTTAPTDPSPAASAAGTPRAIQLSAPPAPASRPAATKPAATQPDAAAPPTSGPAATHPVATAPSGTRPPATPAVATATERDRTCRGRTCRDRTCRDAVAQGSVGSAVSGQPNAEAAPIADVGDAAAAGRKGPSRMARHAVRLAAFACAWSPLAGAGPRTARTGDGIAAGARWWH